MNELTKTTTKEWFACKKCEKKMEEIKIGSGSDLFGFSSARNAFYCDNKECDRYGDLTIVGIKKSE